MTERENWLRAVEFRNPEWIPCRMALSPLTWQTYREKLEELVLSHPLLFKGYQRGSTDFDEFPEGYRKGDVLKDNWGSVWENVIGGLEGQVVEHPLADWSALHDFQPPDPQFKHERGDWKWDEVKADIARNRERGELIGVSGERLFDRLYFLRGFENLMMDFATDDPHLPVLIEMLTEHELKLVNIWLEISVDAIGFHTDIGTQNALMISPEKFRKYIKPMFKRIFRTCRDNGVHVYLSSDGRLLEIVDDLIECGVSVHDPQLRANTLDGIERTYTGKMCANVDLDRQMFPFCSPEDIRRQVREVVERIGSPRGGLMVLGSVSGGDVPLENIEALCASLGEYCLKSRQG